jgi:hypothetical protein
MNGFEVYRLYLALKLHFTKDEFDFFLCNGKTRASVQSFEKRKDSYFFKKLATKFSREELIQYFVANFITNENTWIGNISKIENSKIYPVWKRKIQSMSFTFTNDIANLLDEYNFEELFQVNGSHPPLIVKYLSGSINLETLVILNQLLQYIPDFNKKITEPVIWPGLKRKVVKYEPFLSIDKPKYRKILLDKVC